MKRLLLILLCSPIILFGQQTNQIKKVKNAANTQLGDYLKKIPVGKEKLFGFDNRESFSQAEIGVPYEVFTLNSDFFDHEKVKKDGDYIISTGNWRVPIIVGDEYKGLLTVSKEDNEWQVVKIGAKGLANELERFEQNYPSINSLNILRVFQLKGDFVLISPNVVYPLTSASNGLLVDSDKAYSIYDILTLIKNKNYEK